MNENDEKEMIKKKVKDTINSFQNKNKKIPSDVLGSYTGTSEGDEKPVQDADDL